MRLVLRGTLVEGRLQLVIEASEAEIVLGDALLISLLICKVLQVVDASVT